MFCLEGVLFHDGHYIDHKDKIKGILDERADVVDGEEDCGIDKHIKAGGV